MTYPALDISHDNGDLMLAIVDDYSPTAAEERDSILRIYFPDASLRDLARRALARDMPLVTVTSCDVDDEDWARRSQQNLEPVTVGRITVFPRPRPPASAPQSPGDTSISLVIEPSMGFGTGHHATTRLCLAALQALGVRGGEVLDVGTGSGILALAARLLGAGRVTAIDDDADAIRSAVDNLQLNPGAAGVAFAVGDLRSADLPAADIVTANLTGALLEQVAPRLLAALRPGGTVIVSGLLAAERAAVIAAFPGASPSWVAEEDGWVGLAFTPSASDACLTPNPSNPRRVDSV